MTDDSSEHDKRDVEEAIGALLSSMVNMTDRLKSVACTEPWTEQDKSITPDMTLIEVRRRLASISDAYEAMMFMNAVTSYLFSGSSGEDGATLVDPKMFLVGEEDEW